MQAFFFLLYAVLLGNFGKYSLSEIEFPAVVLMSDVQIKGSFFKRADALMLSVWFFTLFSVLNMSLYYAVLRCENFAENTRKLYLHLIKTGIPVAISNLALTDRKAMTRKRAL